MAYIRTVKTASGARVVQIVHSSRKGSRDIKHVGSAHDDLDEQAGPGHPCRWRETKIGYQLILGLTYGPGRSLARGAARAESVPFSASGLMAGGWGH